MENHSVQIDNREKMTITDIREIDSFDEQSIIVFTDVGELSIRGENLHINKIDVDSGEMTVDGEIYSLGYADDQPQKGGFFSRIFK